MFCPNCKSQEFIIDFDNNSICQECGLLIEDCFEFVDIPDYENRYIVKHLTGLPGHCTSEKSFIGSLDYSDQIKISYLNDVENILTKIFNENISKSISKLSYDYKIQITKKKSYKGKNLQGLKCFCTYYASHIIGFTLTIQEIIYIFNINTKIFSKGKKVFLYQNKLDKLFFPKIRHIKKRFIKEILGETSINHYLENFFIFFEKHNFENYFNINITNLTIMIIVEFHRIFLNKKVKLDEKNKAIRGKNNSKKNILVKIIKFYIKHIMTLETIQKNQIIEEESIISPQFF